MITAFWENIEQHVRLIVDQLGLCIVVCEDATPEGTPYMGIQKQGGRGALVVVEFVKHGFDSKKAWQMVFNLTPEFVAAINAKGVFESDLLSYARIVQATSSDELLVEVKMPLGYLFYWSPSQMCFVEN